MIPVGQVLNFLCGCPGIPPDLLVDLIQKFMLNIVVALLDPEYLAQQVAPAGVQITPTSVLKGSVGHGGQQGVVLQPAGQYFLDRYPIFGDGVLDFQWADVCFHHFLAKIIEVGGKNRIDLLHIDLQLEKMLYIVVDHLQQFNQRLRVIIGTVNCRHSIIDAGSLAGHLQCRICAKDVGVAPHGAVVPQLVKQLQQPAAVPRNGDIFVKIISPLFL